MKKAKKEAQSILLELEVHSPPTPILKITKHYEIDVCEVAFLGYRYISAVCSLKSKTIYLNQADSACTKRVTIARELGRYILHEKPVLEKKLSEKEERDKGFEKIKEYQAFAEELLVPFFILERFKDLSTKKLAELFAVSAEMIENRLYYK